MNIDQKNTLAFKEAIADLQRKDHDKQVRIDALNAALSAMTERMTLLERIIQMQRAASMGSGASVIP